MKRTRREEEEKREETRKNRERPLKSDQWSSDQDSFLLACSILNKRDFKKRKGRDLFNSRRYTNSVISTRASELKRAHDALVEGRRLAQEARVYLSELLALAEPLLKEEKQSRGSRRRRTSQKKNKN